MLTIKTKFYFQKTCLPKTLFDKIIYQDILKHAESFVLKNSNDDLEIFKFLVNKQWDQIKHFDNNISNISLNKLLQEIFLKINTTGNFEKILDIIFKNINLKGVNLSPEHTTESIFFRILHSVHDGKKIIEFFDILDKHKFFEKDTNDNHLYFQPERILLPLFFSDTQYTKNIESVIEYLIFQKNINFTSEEIEKNKQQILLSSRPKNYDSLSIQDKYKFNTSFMEKFKKNTSLDYLENLVKMKELHIKLSNKIKNESFKTNKSNINKI